MAHKKNPAASRVKGIAILTDDIADVTEIGIAVYRLLDIGFRRVPGGKDDWLISIPDLCTDLPISGRKLFRYGSFCKVLKHEFGVVCEPIPEFDWHAIVFSAAIRGVS